MRGILVDHNIEGLFRKMVQRVIEPTDLYEFWKDLAIDWHTLASLNFDLSTSDRVIWNYCQTHEVLLVAENRNNDGPDSLEAVILDSGTSHTLPVVTMSNTVRIRFDTDYARLFAEKLIELCYDIETKRGVGRLYLP